MKLKKLAEVTMWLPGFAPDDPLPMISHVVPSAEIIAFPLVAPIQITVPASNDDVEFVSPALIGETQPQRPPRVLWPSLDATVHSMLRGDVTKFDANLAAVALLSMLDAENRPPTVDERMVLNRYTGWGGISKAFNPDQDDPAWKARAESCLLYTSPSPRD